MQLLASHAKPTKYKDTYRHTHASRQMHTHTHTHTHTRQKGAGLPDVTQSVGQVWNVCLVVGVSISLLLNTVLSKHEGRKKQASG